jgi:acyl-CoA thioesterase FadM
MNNGKYLSILDLARVDLMTRAGVARVLTERLWFPVVAWETIRFRRSLRLFQRFDVETTVLGWNDQAFLVSQRFVTAETVAAEAIVRARFLKRSGGSVTPTEVLAAAGATLTSPSLPDWVAQWNAAQRSS